MNDSERFDWMAARAGVICLVLFAAIQVTLQVYKTVYPGIVDVPPSVSSAYEDHSRKFWQVFKKESVSEATEARFNKGIREYDYDSVLILLKEKNLHDTPAGRYVLAQVAALAGEPYSKQIPSEWLDQIKTANFDPSVNALYLIEKAVYGEAKTPEAQSFDYESSMKASHVMKYAVLFGFFLFLIMLVLGLFMKAMSFVKG